MGAETITEAEQVQLAELVSHYESELKNFKTLFGAIKSMLENEDLSALYHSLRSRMKEPSHLLDKLQRKLLKAKKDNKVFDVTKENLFEKINDLIGFRILHLHTSQFENINTVLLNLLDENSYKVVEGPEARTWDDEQRMYFESIKVAYVKNDRLYTSVHYVISSNTKTNKTCEIQVRTLAEELWGEVDHAINYPHPSSKLACKEQIKVLARITSGCTRLVDSIFASHNEPETPSSTSSKD